VTIDEELERIRSRYIQHDQDTKWQARWSPFSEEEIDHRNQQYGALAGLFRSIGKASLSGLKILDVGCGQGRMLRACLDMGASPGDLTGVDLQASRIEQAKRLSPHLDFRVCNGRDLEFPNETFDLVMEFVVFSSIFAEELRRRVASEMVRVLHPGGYIFWWDCLKTVEGAKAQPLVPQELFPGLPVIQRFFGLRPKPSYGLQQRRRFRLLGRVVDRFGYPASHCAALIGPKPALTK
jgi:ubiquinone/menaquinone biosynthesis C-methylase UbiE